MPYIKRDQRVKIDNLIDELAQKIVDESDNDIDFAGILNYSCTKLSLEIVRKKFGSVRYWMIAMITGVFKNVADEFYRRIATPYENLKITQEGDVEGFQDLSDKIIESSMKIGFGSYYSKEELDQLGKNE